MTDGISHHGCAAEENVVADGGEQSHALLKTILPREDNKAIRQLQRSAGRRRSVILKACSTTTERNLIGCHLTSGLQLL